MSKVLLILLGVMLCVPALADDGAAPDEAPLRRAAAEKLLDLFNMNDTYDRAMQQVTTMAVGMIDSQDIPEAEKARARKAVRASVDMSMERFSWKRMRNVFVDIYADVLSLEELEGVTAFYESPIGQKFLKKQPRLSLATMEKMQLLMKDMMPDLQKAVDEALQLEAAIGGEPGEGEADGSEREVIDDE